MRQAGEAHEGLPVEDRIQIAVIRDTISCEGKKVLEVRRGGGEERGEGEKVRRCGGKGVGR